MDERSKRLEVDADFVVRMLVENVQRSMEAVPVVDSEGNPVGEYRYNGAVANKSLELLGKHLGMFTDKHEVAHRASSNVLMELLEQVENEDHRIIDAEYIERAAIGQAEKET